jgi:hypothetical protein
MNTPNPKPTRERCPECGDSWTQPYYSGDCSDPFHGLATSPADSPSELEHKKWLEHWKHEYDLTQELAQMFHDYGIDDDEVEDLAAFIVVAVEQRDHRRDEAHRQQLELQLELKAWSTSDHAYLRTVLDKVYGNTSTEAE